MQPSMVSQAIRVSSAKANGPDLKDLGRQLNAVF
jgi:hypothetical protein